MALRPPVARPTSIRLDLFQLEAELRGYNAAIRELQAVVMRLERDDLVGLTAAAGQVEQLEDRRRFLTLYLDRLTNAQRRTLPQAGSPELVRQLVLRHAQRQLRETPAHEGDQREALEDLTGRLAQLQDAGLTGF